MSKQAAATSTVQPEAPITPTTSGEWRAFIANLDRSREDAEAKLSDLLVQRNALALKLRLGTKTARARADVIDAEADRLKVEIGEMGAAVAGAEEEARKAGEAETAQAEIDQAFQVQILLLQRAGLAKRLGAAVATLVEATDEWVRSSIELDRLCPLAPSRYIWGHAPLEMIAQGHFGMRSVLGDFPVPAGFEKADGTKTKTWQDLVSHIDRAPMGWTKHVIPADLQAAVDAAVDAEVEAAMAAQAAADTAKATIPEEAA